MNLGNLLTLSPGEKIIEKIVNCIRQIVQILQGRRIRLTAPLTIHIDPNGSDGNDGLAVGTDHALKTFQAAYDYAADNIDLAGFTLTLKSVAGATYNSSSILSTNKEITGSNGPASIIIDGNGSTANNTGGGNTYCFAAGNVTFTGGSKVEFTLQGWTVTSASGGGISATVGATIFCGAGMVFGSCATQHINSSTHAVIFMGDAYSITGSATVHINPQSHSAIYGPVNKTITVGGGLTFSTAFAQASFGGLIAYDSNVTFSSNVATGARAIANQGGIINRIPTASTFFPGNAPPQIASYGIYALGPQLDDHISRLASNFVVTNNATPAFSGLFAPNGVRDGSQYYFEANLYTTSGAGGIRYDIGGTATATAITYDTVQMDANVLTQQARFNALGGATGGAAANAWVKIVGTITVNAAGTLTVEFSQNAVNAAASTLLAGSTFDVRQVN